MRQFSRFADREKKFVYWRAYSHIPQNAGIRVRCRKITYANKLHSGPNVTQRTVYHYQAMFCLPISLAKYETYYDVNRERLYMHILELRHIWRHPVSDSVWK